MIKAWPTGAQELGSLVKRGRRVFDGHARVKLNDVPPPA